jgi:DNA repair exonuclease SbcCD ATPase subunit
VLHGTAIPAPLAEDPAEVARRIMAYVEAQREQRQGELAERLREASRRRREAEERQREASRQWEAAGGIAGFEERMRKLREAEAARGPDTCDVCGREVEPGYAAELRRKSLPARHVLCKPGSPASRY